MCLCTEFTLYNDFPFHPFDTPSLGMIVNGSRDFLET